MDLSRLLCTPRTPRFRPFEPSPSASPSALRQSRRLQQNKPRARELTRDERLRARTLHNEAGWPAEAIATRLQATRRQVDWALQHQLTPQKHKSGRPPVFDTPKRVELQRWFLSNPAYRYMTWNDLRYFLPPELYGPVGETAIIRALRALGYTRRIRRRRVRHTAANRRARVRWCLQMLERFPNPQDWETVIFSDETWANNDPMWKQWVTIHNTEDPDAFALLRRHPVGWMFWGCFAGGRKGPGYIWPKGYGGINRYNYCANILPLVARFRTFELGGRGTFQQDNAPAHRARLTKQTLEMLGIPLLHWPANSPDLNPIENVWFVMKDWIERHYDVQSLSLEDLYEAIWLAWESIDSDFLLKLAHSMPNRLQKCIDNGGKLINF